MSFEILAELSWQWAGLLPETMIVDGPGDLLRMARSCRHHGRRGVGAGHAAAVFTNET
jgi:hypothetical protein